MAKRGRRSASTGAEAKAESYQHPQADLLLRPDVGTQAQFKKKKPPVTYRYDSSLSPMLEWDGQNPARELGEWLLDRIEAAAALPPPHVFNQPQEFKRPDGGAVVIRGLHEAVDQLRRLSGPFLTWAGKAEGLSFEVPTLPLFVHERLSTKAIIETLRGHQRQPGPIQPSLFGDPQHSVVDQVLKAYEHRDPWVNRLILGDSLVVMNSLLQYEGLGGQVQMIYTDPPYGIKFGSNFQPFIRKRDVKHNEDEDMTREPEMVKAYRDTWELGLHSYLSYLRDRFYLCKELLHPRGSIFVQISDENLHHVREVLDDVFGEENFCGVITVQKTESQTSERLSSISDYLLWYARAREQVKYRQMFLFKELGRAGATGYTYLESPDGKVCRSLTAEELRGPALIPRGWRLFDGTPLVSQSGGPIARFSVDFNGKTYTPGHNFWKTNKKGFDRLIAARRIVALGSRIEYKRYFDDFPVYPIANLWTGLGERGFVGEKLYVVQTAAKVVARCLLMTTDPGELVLDPTCGSGTTAYVAEQWGRRWTTIDTSRVPLALTRQRLLTATFPYYQLKDESRGPASGFVYRRKQNTKGEEVGGIVPHITLKSIANDETTEEKVLVDRPEVDKKITRVSGPFCLEATIPTPVDWGADGLEASSTIRDENDQSFLDRMLTVLRQSPILQLGGGRTVTLRNIRLPAKTLSLAAEAVVEGDNKPVAVVFGPENGAISEKLVYEAAREAHAKTHSHLFVIGFAIQPNARNLIEKCDAAVGISATYVQATPDLIMGDLLKNLRSSQIFSVCGLPEVALHRVEPPSPSDPTLYQAELKGLDVFDPVNMTTDHRRGDDVPAWFLDSDYNGLCFHVCQAFFPRTGAWDHLQRALRSLYDESVCDNLAGTKSALFPAGEQGQVAVKVIDDRGNELLVVKALSEART